MLHLVGSIYYHYYCCSAKGQIQSLVHARQALALPWATNPVFMLHLYQWKTLTAFSPIITIINRFYYSHVYAER
jgi:hypothetical protein